MTSASTRAPTRAAGTSLASRTTCPGPGTTGTPPGYPGGSRRDMPRRRGMRPRRPGPSRPGRAGPGRPRLVLAPARREPHEAPPGVRALYSHHISISFFSPGRRPQSPLSRARRMRCPAAPLPCSLRRRPGAKRGQGRSTTTSASQSVAQACAGSRGPPLRRGASVTLSAGKPGHPKPARGPVPPTIYNM